MQRVEPLCGRGFDQLNQPIAHRSALPVPCRAVPTVPTPSAPLALVETRRSRDDYRMRATPRAGSPLLAAGIALVAVLVGGCSGPPAGSPTRLPSVAVVAGPPLAGDLSGGTPVQLGAASHWAIRDGRAFVATAPGTVRAVELSTGVQLWQASFEQGEPWDATPTLAVSSDGSEVVAVRTVDSAGAARLDLLRVATASGERVSERLIADPGHRWRVDLPPRVLAVDAETVVLSSDPESGRQSAVVSLLDGSIAWTIDQEAIAATADTVITRLGGQIRTNGAHRWVAARPLGPLLALSAHAVVVAQDSRAVRLDPRSGEVDVLTTKLSEVDAPCVRTATEVVACLGAPGVVAQDLALGRQLWSSRTHADGIAAIADWLYLWHSPDRGDVLDARTGEVLQQNVDLPAIRYADASGVLLAADDGYRWVPYPR